MPINTHASDPQYSSFLWNHKNILMPLSLALPLLLQVTSIVLKIFRDPGIVKEKIHHFKQFIIETYTRGENETPEEFKKRLIKNAVLTTFFVLGAAALITVPFIGLPSIFAISVALTAILEVGRFLANAKENANKARENWSKFKITLSEAFVPRKGELRQDAALRILRNIAITIVATVAIAAAAVAATYGIAIVVGLATGALSPWFVYKLLPGQTPLVVFCEYLTLAVAHGALAVKKFKEGKNVEALFHLTNALLGVFFPIFYLNWEGPIRLHHSFLGLLIALAPFDTLRMYGALTTLDSFAYVFSPFRGHWVYHDGFYNNFWEFKSWDFQNLVLENGGLYAAFYGAATAIERTVKNFFRRVPKKEPSSEMALKQFNV